MNHPTEDELLLLAYGELSAQRAAEIESHVAACGACAEQLAPLERARVALDLAVPARPRRAVMRWAIGVGLAAAAVLAGILIVDRQPASERHWNPPTTWSATAGYIASGNAAVEIDAQLTRLEQERYRAVPN